MSESGEASRSDVRLYIDTNIFVYAMETADEDGQRARRLMLQVQRREIEAVTSEITLAEALRGGSAAQDEGVFQAYLQLLAPEREIKVVPVSRNILVEAARLVTTRKIELPDAIHVATALIEKCEVFLTNDKRLPVAGDLKKQSLAEWGEEG